MLASGLWTSRVPFTRSKHASSPLSWTDAGDLSISPYSLTFAVGKCGLFACLEGVMNCSTRRGHLAVAAPEPRVRQQTDNPTVGKYLEEWLRGKQSLRPSTHLAYETHIRRYLVPHLGHLELSRLRPGDIEAMYRHLASEANPRGRRLSMASLRRIQ